MARPIAMLVAFIMGTNIGRLVVLAGLVAVLGAFAWQLAGILPSSVWLIAMFGSFAYVASQYVRVWQGLRVRRFIGTGEDLKRVYARMPSANVPPVPPFWCFSPYLQFVPWMLCNMVSAAVVPIPFEEELVEVKGLADRTKPEGPSNPRSMVDEVVVNIYPPTCGASDGLQLPLSAPAIFVEPGLTSTAQDVPGSSIMRLAVHRGFRVVVVERRGHRKPLKAARWNIFGDSDDVEQVYKAVRQKLPDAPFFWIGLSSGSALVVESMGKFDERRARGDASAPSFVATACIAPGYDCETCFKKFKWPLSKITLAGSKGKFMTPNEAVLRAHDGKAYDHAMDAEDLQTMTNRAAAFAGYPSAEAFYKHENPTEFAHLITTPMVILNADDDPMCLVENAFADRPSPVDAGKRVSFAQQVEEGPGAMLLISSTGSHCPFMDGAIFPFAFVPQRLGWMITSCWGERCALEFFEAYLVEAKAKAKAKAK